MLLSSVGRLVGAADNDTPVVRDGAYSTDALLLVLPLGSIVDGLLASLRIGGDDDAMALTVLVVGPCDRVVTVVASGCWEGWMRVGAWVVKEVGGGGREPLTLVGTVWCMGWCIGCCVGCCVGCLLLVDDDDESSWLMPKSDRFEDDAAFTGEAGDGTPALSTVRLGLYR